MKKTFDVAIHLATAAVCGAVCAGMDPIVAGLSLAGISIAAAIKAAGG
ncbi:MAG: hypothetical protein AAGK00_13085 [Pseudomonadota bacterium]